MKLLSRVFPQLFGEAPTMPTPDEARQISESCAKSPDLGKLEQYEFQLLFCPDRAQRGHKEYPLIEDSVYMCHAFTVKPFNYWLQRDGLPIPMEATSAVRTNLFPPPLKVKGEVHAVRPYQFRDLDNYRDNGVQFIRKRVKLAVPDRPLYKIPERYVDGKPIPLMTGQYVIGTEAVEPLKAWMYVGNPAYWDDLLDAGYNSSGLFKAVPHYKSRRSWLKEYYELTRREETF